MLLLSKGKVFLTQFTHWVEVLKMQLWSGVSRSGRPKGPFMLGTVCLDVLTRSSVMTKRVCTKC